MHDIKQIINDRIIGQYKDSPVILAFIESLSSEYDLVHNEIRRVINERFFDNAEKINLDIIGEIVGIGRQVTDFVDTDYFSFLQDPTGKGFDSLTEKVKAGRYRSADENTVTTRKLIDSEYKVLISAKILKNISNITPNDVLLITRKILSLMYPNITINVNIEETGNASFRIKINYILSTSEKSFISSLDLIPRPVGVKIEYIYEDIDIALEVSLNTNLGDTVSLIGLSAPFQSLISVQLDDSISSINSNIESDVVLDNILGNSITLISVAPPGTVTFDLILEDSVSNINMSAEQESFISNTIQNSIVSIISGVENSIDMSVLLSNSSVSGSMTVSDPIPLAPTGLTVTAPTNNSLTINFNTSVYATGYKIYRDLVEIADIVGTNFVDSTLISGTTYSYTVSAYNPQGESLESPAVSGTTVQPYLFEGTAITLGNPVDLDVWGTFEYSIDGGSSFASVSGAPFSIQGTPTGDVFIKATTGITQIKLQNNYFATLKIRETTGSFNRTDYMFGPIFQNYSMISIDITEFNTSNVTRMDGMFSYCNLITTLDVSGMSLNSSTNIASMFRGMSALTSLNLSSFNTATISSAMSWIFDGCSSLTSLDLSSFNTSKTTSFDNMFLNTTSLSSVTVNPAIFLDTNAFTMVSMFENSAIASFDFSGFSFSGMTSMQKVFKNCSSLVCVTNINTSQATNRTEVFLNNASLVAPNATQVADLTDASGANYINAGNCP